MTTVHKAYLEVIKKSFRKKDGTLRPVKRPATWLYPHSAQRQYTAALYQYTFQIRKTITSVLYPKIPIWLAGATLTYPDPVFPKMDSIIDDVINDLNLSLQIIYRLLLPYQTEAQNKAKFFGLEIAAFNSAQYSKVVNSVLGVDVFLEEPWLVPQLELFANQNAQLITSMTGNEIERVSGYIQRALQEGSSYESVVENIEKSFGITRRHAKLIARDQTTKLNGSLTKLRQQELGINEYVWQTAGDERVRADHRVMDGKICRWDDPTVYDNEKTGKWEKRSKIGGTEVHTSQDVNCRCIPIPNIKGLLNG